MLIAGWCLKMKSQPQPQPIGLVSEAEAEVSHGVMFVTPKPERLKVLSNIVGAGLMADDDHCAVGCIL